MPPRGCNWVHQLEESRKADGMSSAFPENGVPPSSFQWEARPAPSYTLTRTDHPACRRGGTPLTQLKGRGKRSWQSGETYKLCNLQESSKTENKEKSIKMFTMYKK